MYKKCVGRQHNNDSLMLADLHTAKSLVLFFICVCKNWKVGGKTPTMRANICAAKAPPPKFHWPCIDTIFMIKLS